jgi:hypothetical protein
VLSPIQRRLGWSSGFPYFGSKRAEPGPQYLRPETDASARQRICTLFSQMTAIGCPAARGPPGDLPGPLSVPGDTKGSMSGVRKRLRLGRARCSTVRYSALSHLDQMQKPQSLALGYGCAFLLLSHVLRSCAWGAFAALW